MKTKVTKDLENKTLIIERSFDATKEQLWPYYAEKEKFEAWWGPEGWETTTKEFDFRPGGRVHYDMKCVDKNQGEWYGKSSWGLMQIDTVDAPNSFTYTDYFSDEEGNIAQDMPGLKVTNELIEEDGKVKLLSTSYAGSAEDIEKLLAMGMAEGFDSQLNKLDVLFAK
jgi:uncharacterized protein YndB with AHSA1/START domain